jgi:CDP-glucose 4,6-dehydratase
MVVASSDKAYGDAPELPYFETHRLDGKSPYDVSKVCTDLLAQTYHQHYGLPVCIVRCGNIFGGGDLNWNRLIPGTIRACHYGEPIVIRSDGTLVRDYIYVRDVVESYLAIAAAMDQPGIPGQAFNVSNATPMTVSDVAERLCAAMNRPYAPQVLGGAQDEIRAQYLDSNKIRTMVGWTPRFTFDAALAETIEWYRRQQANDV